jgi:hypothetical protein
LFVIVAAGLVLSWGQIGHKAGRVALDGLLDTETPCRPYSAPCAAYGSDIALVLGPGPGSDLLLKASTRRLPRGLEVGIIAADHSVSQPVVAEALAAGVWRLYLGKREFPDQAKLVIELEEASLRAVFPLASQ